MMGNSQQDILDVVDSMKKKIVLKALNTSFIALIPKQENAITPDRFRPIALCNVVYKIISKVIANKLKPLLPTLVSKEQIGYVEVGKFLITSFKLTRWFTHLRSISRQV